MNSTFKGARAPLFIALLGLGVAALTGRADAQLMVHMKLNNTDYMAHEAIMATVTVHNRAGQDVVLNGPGGSGWLTFDVFRGQRMVSPRPGAQTGTKPFVLGAGKSVTKEVNVGSIFPINDWGNYSIKAGVYFPPLRTFFNSTRQLIAVTDAKPFWSQSVGVPQGRGRLAEFREFSLLEHRGKERTEIYVRLKDTRGGRVFCTYSLGRYVNVSKPQATVDSQNRLHVMHMVGPRIYQHATVNAEGSFLGAELFKESGRERPSLVIDPSGVVKVRGGMRYDPRREAAAAASATRGRTATERPAGLPR